MQFLYNVKCPDQSIAPHPSLQTSDIICDKNTQGGSPPSSTEILSVQLSTPLTHDVSLLETIRSAHPN